MRELEAVGFDATKPTLFIAECVLVYLDSEDTVALLATLASTVADACFINYEMVTTLAPRTLPRPPCPAAPAS